MRKACHLEMASRYEVLSEFLYDLEHPNSNFLQIEEPVKPEVKLKKYRWYLGLRKIFAIDSIVSSQVPIEGLSSLSLSVPTVSNKVCPLMQSMPLLTGESQCVKPVI
jgi:hypothetical protein